MEKRAHRKCKIEYMTIFEPVSFYKEINEENRQQILTKIKQIGGMTTLYNIKRALAVMYKKDKAITNTLFKVHGTLSPDIVILHWLMDFEHTGLKQFLDRWKDTSEHYIKGGFE